MSLGSGIRDARSGIRNKPIPDPGPGSRGQKGTGSRIRIRNTAFYSLDAYRAGAGTGAVIGPMGAFVTYSHISMASGFMKLKSLVGFPLGILKRIEMPRFMKGCMVRGAAILCLIFLLFLQSELQYFARPLYVIK
jgi:hypothetical protein